MAKRLPNGVIVLDSGEPVYGDDPISAQALFEILRIISPSPAWPFIGGGGGGGVVGRGGTNGPQGNQGIVGPVGPQGLQGPQGPQGSQGQQGFFGNQGLSGTSPQGPQGPQGNQGAQGFQGFSGLVGPQGNQGSQGPQGFQGAQGFRGVQGNQGNQGNIGDTLTALFEFSHTAGGATTGPIGFTPRFCIYSMIVTDAFSSTTSHVLGFANASSELGAGWGIGPTTIVMDRGGVAGAAQIAGEVSADISPPLTVGFFNYLDVSAFSSAGVVLDWVTPEGPVLAHSGKMLVVGS